MNTANFNMSFLWYTYGNLSIPRFLMNGWIQLYFELLFYILGASLTSIVGWNVG